MSKPIEIVVDGMPVEVDQDEYEADQASTIEQVRTARAEMVGDLSEYAEFPDFDTLAALAAELNPDEAVS